MDLFENDFGLGYWDYRDFPIDIFDSGSFKNNFMKCKFYTGDRVNNKPIRVVCGNFQSQITNSDNLRFALKIKNPSSFSIGSVSIPLLVYSYIPI